MFILTWVSDYNDRDYHGSVDCDELDTIILTLLSIGKVDAYRDVRLYESADGIARPVLSSKL